MKLSSCNKGFTLVEMLLAMVVLGLAASTGYGVLRTVVGRYQIQRDHALAEGQLMVAGSLLARDLREAYIAVDQQKTHFVGRLSPEEPGSRIDFCRIQTLASLQPAEVGYFFKRQPNNQWQLWRRLQEALDADPLTGGRESLVCDSVKAFRVAYFDGKEWTFTWGWDSERQRPFEGIRGLPLAATIELTILTARGQEESLHWTVPVMTALLNRTLHG